ncbi:MAG TPA: FG-GAP-like repeat-containing protein [Pyrinomonadaceae bacterium]|jgi:uncharacterized repeat protein (TIGR01451 family)
MPRPPYRLAQARPSVARVLFFFVCLLTAALSLSQTLLPAGSAESRRPSKPEHDGAAARLSEGYGELPLRFEANRGQSSGRVKFIARGSGYTLFLAGTGAVLRLRGAEAAGGEGDGSGEARRREATLGFRLEGANRSPKIDGLSELPGRSNYLVGRDARGWRTGVPAFEKVKYESVYPGIDAVYYGRQGRLEYDFVVAPGANPARIRLALDGARAVRVDEAGDLVITTDAGDVRQQRPFAYQESEGARTEVAARYRIDARGRVRFELGDYDRSRPLVIDPVLVYSSYLGGIDADQALSVAVDSAGSAYVVGVTASADFPVGGALQPAKSGFSDAFVMKLSPDGKSLVYATYLGGSGDDLAYAVAVDAAGNAYVGGLTASGGFPTTPGSFQPSKDGVADAFVAKLNPAGTGLVYSTHIGGQGSEHVNSIAVDAAGAAYVAGRTDSTHFTKAPGVTRAGSAAYRSTDGGASWVASAAGLTASGVSDFAVAPGAPNVVYAAANLGVYRSTDGGANWQAAGEGRPSTAPHFTRSVAVDPSNSAVVYAGTNGVGVYKSTDGGFTFDLKNNGLLVPSVNSLAVHPTAPATLFAGTVFGIYRTTDGGENWAEVRGGLPAGTAPNVNEVVVVPSNPQPVVFAATTNRGLLKSTDGGTNWAPANTGLTVFGSQLQPRTLAFDPTNTSTLYVAVTGLGFGGGVVYKSTDGGANWANSSAGMSVTANGQTITPTVNALLVDPAAPSNVYAGTAFGVFKSTNGGANWAPASAGLANASVQALAMRAGSPAAVLAGTLTGADGFVVKLNPSGSLPEYLRMLGGSENDDARGVALGAGGSAYVVGTTSSADFPVSNAFQPTLGGSTDAHLTKLDATGATLFSTYLGGTSIEQGAGVAVGPDGAAYVVGGTGSTNFPTANALQPSIAEFDVTDAFVTRFAPNGQTLAYSTYLGGGTIDQGVGIAVGADGSAYVAGMTASPNFPQVEPARGYGGGSDAFVARLNPAGSALLFSTHLGGTSNDQGNALALGAAGDIFLVGATSSTDFPVAGAVRGTYGGGRSDAFVAKLGVEADVSVTVAESNDPVMVGGPLSYTFNVTNAGPSPATGVTLSYTFPPGLSFVSAAPSQGSCNAGGQTVTCALGGLPASGSATVVVGFNTTAAGFVNSTANVAAGEPDHNPSNNSATAETKISASPTIRGRVTAPGGAALAGVNVTLSGPQQAMVQTDANGFYQFAEIAAGGNYVVTPSKAGVSFEPASRAFNNLGADQTADFTGTTCTWTLTPATQSFGAGGGGGTVTVNTLHGCPWTAASGSDWITVTSGASGTDAGTVSFTVAPSGVPRAGRLTIAGQNFPVYQELNSCGLPSFTAAKYNTQASSPNLVETADLNADGYNDLVVVTSGSSGFDIEAGVLINNGAGGGFTASTFHTGLGGPKGLTLGDFNGDARPDVAVWGWVTPYVRVHFNNGSGGFGQSATNVELGAGVYPSPNARGVMAADVNKDGKDDLLVSIPESGSLRVLLGNGAGGFAAAAPVGTKVGGAAFYLQDVADVNGDGKPDLLLASSDKRQVSARLGDGAGGFGPDIISETIEFGAAAMTGDFDADGRLDLVYLSVVCDGLGSNCGTSIVVAAGDGGGRFTLKSRVDNTNAYTLAVADFNRDGKLDVAYMTLAGSLVVRPGDGVGGFVPAPTAAPGSSSKDADAAAQQSGLPGIVAADFNRDGRADLATPGITVYTNQCAAGPSISGRVTDQVGLGGVTVTLSGTQSATTQTDAGGNYVFGGLTPGASYVVTPSKENYRFSPASANVNSLPAAGQTADFVGTPMLVRLATGHHVVAENMNGFLKIDVVRTGDTSGPATVDYSTGPGTYNTASDRSDYTYAGGTLRFAAGETTKSFNVLLNDDRLLESWESFTINLSNPTGAILGFATSALVEIQDNELSQPASNPIDESHIFVRQHYHDFLNRDPDQSGLEFWTWEIEQCGADAACREVRRVNVSAAFFLSIEFQETGYLVYRVHTAAFAAGQALNQKTFLKETQEIGSGVVVGPGDEWKAKLAANKQAYVNAFVQRPEFVAAYPLTMTPAQFVDALNANTGGSLTAAERDALVASLASGATTRAGILRAVAENAEFSRRELNKAFVLSQYFGYLRRGPSEPPDADFVGYNFWLGKLNEFNGNYVAAEMVKAFITSDEYRKRFGQ